MINIVVAVCVLFGLASFAVTIYVLWLTDRERKRLIGMLAAKDYQDYMAFEKEPEGTDNHRNLFLYREDARQKKRAAEVRE